MASFRTSGAARTAEVTAIRQRVAGLAVPQWYYVAAIFFILHAISAFGFVDRLVYGTWPGKPGDKITESVNILAILASVALFAKGGRGTKTVGPGAGIVLGLGLFVVCSVLWSVDRGETMRQSLIYLPMLVGSIGIASNLSADEYMHLLARMCFLAAMGSLVLLVLAPASAGVPGNDFGGIFSQKNVLGEVMQIGALASLHGLREGNGRRLQSAVYLLGLVALALMSRSATSCLVIVVYCAGSATFTLVRRGSLGRFLAIVGILVMLGAVASIAMFPDYFLEVIGRNPTLTGRTRIWAAVIPYIWQRPLLGWGFVAFWSPKNPAAGAVAISSGLNFNPGEAHNGLLEALLEVGALGTGLFLFLVARTVWIAIKCLRTTAELQLAVTCLLCCVGIVMLGLTEQVLVAATAASTSVFFITGFMCERAVRAAELPRNREQSRPRSTGERSAGWLRSAGARRATLPSTVPTRPAPRKKGYKRQESQPTKSWFRRESEGT